MTSCAALALVSGCAHEHEAEAKETGRCATRARGRAAGREDRNETEDEKKGAQVLVVASWRIGNNLTQVEPAIDTFAADRLSNMPLQQSAGCVAPRLPQFVGRNQVIELHVDCRQSDLRLNDNADHGAVCRKIISIRSLV